MIDKEDDVTDYAEINEFFAPVNLRMSNPELNDEDLAIVHTERGEFILGELGLSVSRIELFNMTIEVFSEDADSEAEYKQAVLECFEDSVNMLDEFGINILTKSGWQLDPPPKAPPQFMSSGPRGEKSHVIRFASKDVLVSHCGVKHRADRTQLVSTPLADKPICGHCKKHI